MAYKFQIGEARLSGSITQTSGSGDLQALTVDSLNASNGGISNAGAIAGVTTVSGSGQFQVGSIAIGGTAVSATATELNRMQNVSFFNEVSGKAMLRDDNGLTIDGLVNGNPSFVLNCDDNGDASSLKVRQGNSDNDDIELRAGSGISLDAGSNFINASEINVLNSVTAGTAAASKALVLDSSLDIAGINTGSFAFISCSGDIVGSGLLLGSTSGFITGVLQDDGNGQVELQLASGGGLQEASNELEIKLPAGSGLATDSNGLKVDTGGVTNDMLAGSIANGKLASSAMTIAGTSVSLGGSIAASVIAAAVDGENMAITGLTDLDVAAAGDITILDSVGGNTLTIGAASTTVAIAGDLQVDGDLTYVNTTNLRVTDAKVVFADGATGLAAGQGFYIGADDGSSDEKASFAVGNGSGTNDAFVSSLNISASAYFGDGSNLSGVTADSAVVLFEQTASVSATSKTLDVQNDGTFVLVDNSSNVVAITLPAAADADGMTFKIKKTTSNTVNAVTVDASGSQTIDGNTAAINLDSPYAAVNLFSDGTQWLIY